MSLSIDTLIAFLLSDSLTNPTSNELLEAFFGCSFSVSGSGVIFLSPIGVCEGGYFAFDGGG